MRCFAFLLLTLPAFAQAPAEPADALGWLNRGVQLFKSAKYDEAVRAFQRSIDLNPGAVNAHLYLGTAFFSQYVPGADSPANRDLARRAETAFHAALAIDSQNRLALATMASLKFQESAAAKTHADKLPALEEAEGWYRRLIAIDTGDKDALYGLGVIAWAKVYPETQRARAGAGMRPEDPGPIRDNAVRLELRNRYGPVIRDGIASLQKAIELYPQHDDAMAYLNLLYRQLADVSDSVDESRKHIGEADSLVQRALETKRAKTQAGISPTGSTPPPPPPPPGSPDAQVPQQIRVGGNVMAGKLVSKRDPVYPPLAVQARIQGTVRFNAVIGVDGAIANLTLVSGHPILVPEATEAVRQWRYQSTLLNGQPVEVVTQIDVNFVMSA